MSVLTRPGTITRSFAAPILASVAPLLLRAPFIDWPATPPFATMALFKITCRQLSWTEGFLTLGGRHNHYTLWQPAITRETIVVITDNTKSCSKPGPDACLPCIHNNHHYSYKRKIKWQWSHIAIGDAFWSWKGLRLSCSLHRSRILFFFLLFYLWLHS